MTASPFVTSNPISMASSSPWSTRRNDSFQFTPEQQQQTASSLYDLSDCYSPPCAPPPSPLLSLSQEPTIDDSPFWEVGAMSFSQAYEDADKYCTDGTTSWVESSTVEVINQLRNLKIDFDSYRAAASPPAGSTVSPSFSSSSQAFFSFSPQRP